jgi:uncharacterized protein
MCRHQGGARRRPPDPDGALCRRCRLLEKLRGYLHENGIVVSKVVDGKETEGAKFRDWFDFREGIKDLPSHRALALLRGRNEGHAAPIAEDRTRTAARRSAPQLALRDHGRQPLRHQGPRPRRRPLAAGNRALAWMVKLSLHLELELMNQLREQAEEEAIRVFARNLHDLLLAAPAGPRTTLGLDPGIRTGVKVAVVDATGKAARHRHHLPARAAPRLGGIACTLAVLCKKHGVDLIAIGNGTASRETDKLAADLIKGLPELQMTKIVVSEAGASVYSASELAAKEFPDLDVSLRGAVSIARRLQDPLAELVKIDPKSIGVGQYQHDVNQSKLARSLDAVVEDCVNAVGVDVNTASVPLLTRISGLNAHVWHPTSSPTATAMAPSKPRRSCARCRAWATRPSNRPPASCAS